MQSTHKIKTSADTTIRGLLQYCSELGSQSRVKREERREFRSTSVVSTCPPAHLPACLPACPLACYEPTAATDGEPRTRKLGLREGWLACMRGVGGTDGADDADTGVDPGGSEGRTTSGTPVYPSTSSGSSPFPLSFPFSLSSPSCEASFSLSFPLVRVIELRCGCGEEESTCGRAGSGMAISMPRRRGTSTTCCGSGFGLADARRGCGRLSEDCGWDDEGARGELSAGSWRIPSLGAGIEGTEVPPTDLRALLSLAGGCGGEAVGRGRRLRKRSERAPR